MVNTIVSGHHIDLTQGLKTHIQSKVQLLNKKGTFKWRKPTLGYLEKV